jgi:hypothetical protein
MGLCRDCVQKKSLHESERRSPTRLVGATVCPLADTVAEVAVSRELFQTILERIARLKLATAPQSPSARKNGNGGLPGKKTCNSMELEVKQKKGTTNERN